MLKKEKSANLCLIIEQKIILFDYRYVNLYFFEAGLFLPFFFLFGFKFSFSLEKKRN